MSTTPNPYSELESLLRALSDDDLSPTQRDRLNELLLDDPDACELCLNHLTLDSYLRTEIGSSIPTALPLSRIAHFSKASKWPVVRFVQAIAALLVLGAFVSTIALRAGPLKTTTVATVLLAENCEWESSRVLQEGQPLPPGPLHLLRGVAVIRFESGAAVVLKDDTLVKLETRGAIRVIRGQVSVRANEESIGFTVHTPASDVVDLGTEFSVNVESGGATELQVHDGSVTYTKPGFPESEGKLLTGGKGMRYDNKDQSMPREISANGVRFDDLLQKANLSPRKDLLMAHEEFDYPEGLLPLEKAGNGRGWIGSWQVAPLVANPPAAHGALKIGKNNILAPWLDTANTSALEAGPGFESRMRRLANPVRLDTDHITYIGMLVHWNIPPMDPVLKDQRFLRLVLRSSADYTGDKIAFTLPAFLRPQIQTASGVNFTSPTHAGLNETQFWCAKIIARKDGEDEIFFRIFGENETPEFVEPSTWSVVSNGVYSNTVLDTLVLAATGQGTCWFGDIRIGSSWRAIVPSKAIFTTAHKTTP